jgi:hypothetical protein
VCVLVKWNFLNTRGSSFSLNDDNFPQFELNRRVYVLTSLVPPVKAFKIRAQL